MHNHDQKTAPSFTARRSREFHGKAEISIWGAEVGRPIFSPIYVVQRYQTARQDLGFEAPHFSITSGKLAIRTMEPNSLLARGTQHQAEGP